MDSVLSLFQGRDVRSGRAVLSCPQSAFTTCDHRFCGRTLQTCSTAVPTPTLRRGQRQGAGVRRCEGREPAECPPFVRSGMPMALATMDPACRVPLGFLRDGDLESSRVLEFCLPGCEAVPHGEGGTLWEEAVGEFQKAEACMRLRAPACVCDASAPGGALLRGNLRPGPPCPKRPGLAAQRPGARCAAVLVLQRTTSPASKVSSTRGTFLSPEDGGEPERLSASPFAPVVQLTGNLLRASFCYAAASGSHGLEKGASIIQTPSGHFHAPPCHEAMKIWGAMKSARP